MEQPKKERKFLKGIVKIAKTLGEELVLGIGRKYIGKVVDKIRIGKRQQMTILFALITSCLFAQYPATGNKQRLGYQTTADGLVWRGRASDTVSLKSSTINNAYIIIDTINNVMFNYIKTKGGWQFNNTDTVIVNNNFTQPIDSLFFKTSVSPNNVDTAKMRWDYDLATVVLGMYDQVPNELGFKNFWLVKNQTGSTIAKGSVVYASGTVGASGRIAVSKFIANGTIEAKLVLGVTAHDLSNGEDGYVIDFGKIRQVNTDTFAAGSILYPSPTTAGAFTDVEPQAPNITMPIAFCINSSSNNGTIAIRVASGYKMHEIQDVDTTGINTNEGLVYNGSYFVASNGKLLTPSDTTSLSNRIDTKLNTTTAASTYLPLTGGTLTGSLTGTTGTFTALNVNNTSTEGILKLQGYDNNTATKIQFNTFNIIRQEIIKPTTTSNLQFRSYPTGTASGGYEFYVSNGSAESLAATIGTDKGLTLSGTLGVTGATTLSGALTVNNATVLNEGSGDYDTRIESDGNANMVFVDASTDRVGIGTNIPSKTLDLVGTLGVSSTATFAGNAIVNGSLTVNEDGSSVGVFRVEGDNNTSLIQTAPASDYVGIGRVPENSFDVQGAVRFRTLTLNGTPTRIIGADATGDINQITLGSGLSLSSGTLSATATGTVTSVTGTAPIVSSGGTAPVISVNAATSSASGVVSATTQSFGGNKTFTGIVGLNKVLQRPVETITVSSASITTGSTWIIVNNAGTVTLTLPSASTSTGTEYFIKTITNNTVVSASSNIVPLAGGSAGPSILSGTAGKWATLVSDGSNWVIMQAN